MSKNNAKTLEDLKKKYPDSNFKFPPNPSCKFCKGTGEKFMKKKGKLDSCICLYIDHEFSDDIGSAIGGIARTFLK